MVLPEPRVDQIFINTSDRDLEAQYSFPVPNGGSLSEVSLWIDGQEVVGVVLEKELERAGSIRSGTGTIDKEFWKLPRLSDSKGLALKALLEEREELR